jgi:hypothetical protein
LPREATRQIVQDSKDVQDETLRAIRAVAHGEAIWSGYDRLAESA